MSENDNQKTAAEAITETIKDAAESAAETVKDAAETAVDTASAAVPETVKETVADAASAVVPETVKETVVDAASVVVPETVKETVADAASAVKETATEAVETATAAVDTATDAAAEVAEKPEVEVKEETPVEPEEISYHAVENEGEITAIWEMQGQKHLRTIDPRSNEGQKIFSLFTSDIHETDAGAVEAAAS